MQLSDTEWTVMRAVWELENSRRPVTARGVLELTQVQTRWAYSTVKTLLTRLAAKAALDEWKDGQQSRYESIVSISEARQRAVRKLLDRAFDGDMGTLLHHLLVDESLSPGDRAELGVLAQELEQRTGTGG